MLLSFIHASVAVHTEEAGILCVNTCLLSLEVEVQLHTLSHRSSHIPVSAALHSRAQCGAKAVSSYNTVVN